MEQRDGKPRADSEYNRVSAFEGKFFGYRHHTGETGETFDWGLSVSVDIWKLK